MKRDDIWTTLEAKPKENIHCKSQFSTLHHPPVDAFVPLPTHLGRSLINGPLFFPSPITTHLWTPLFLFRLISDAASSMALCFSPSARSLIFRLLWSITFLATCAISWQFSTSTTSFSSNPATEAASAAAPSSRYLKVKNFTKIKQTENKGQKTHTKRIDRPTVK